MAFLRLLAGFFAAFGLDLPRRRATTERVVVNRYSGLAIEGFDPVAYFTDSQPRPGAARFRGPRVRAPSGASAMRATAPPLSPIPEIYGPQFGGYDPVDLGRGVTYAGNPRFWAMHGDSGFICSAARRTAMPSPPIPARFLKDATPRWPALEQGLSQ